MPPAHHEALVATKSKGQLSNRRDTIHAIRAAPGQCSNSPALDRARMTQDASTGSWCASSGRIGALVMTANFLGEASVRDQQRLQDCAYSSLRLADLLRRSSLA